MTPAYNAIFHLARKWWTACHSDVFKQHQIIHKSSFLRPATKKCSSLTPSSSQKSFRKIFWVHMKIRQTNPTRLSYQAAHDISVSGCKRAPHGRQDLVVFVRQVSLDQDTKSERTGIPNVRKITPLNVGKSHWKTTRRKNSGRKSFTVNHGKRLWWKWLLPVTSRCPNRSEWPKPERQRKALSVNRRTASLSGI